MNSEKKSILKSHVIRPNLRQGKGSELISVLETNGNGICKQRRKRRDGIVHI
jgi:hypothetical protein